MLHEKSYRGAINLGNPVELSVRALADEVVRLTGTRSAISFKPLPVDDPRRRRPDIALATQVLDWAPQVPLFEGLARTIAHFAAEADAAAAVPLAQRWRGHTADAYRDTAAQ
jgi:UDP-glucuronate decarboxylase